MVDEIKKNIIPDADENSGDNNENLNEDLDFSDELSKLEDQIRYVAGNKIKERENKKNAVVQDTSSELASLGVDVSLVGNEKGKDKVSEFFGKGKEEFKEIDTEDEKKVVKIYDKIKNRPIIVQREIEKSADKILNEIYNWEEEKNPVARSLLRIVNSIMSLEK